MTGYAFHPEAVLDLEEIWDFIAEDSPTAADKVIAEILNTIEGLVPFPQQGYRRSDLTSRPLRFANTREHLIAYAPDEQPLLVYCRDPWPPKSARAGRGRERKALDPLREARARSSVRAVSPGRFQDAALAANLTSHSHAREFSHPR